MFLSANPFRCLFTATYVWRDTSDHYDMLFRPDRVLLTASQSGLLEISPKRGIGLGVSNSLQLEYQF